MPFKKAQVYSLTMPLDAVEEGEVNVPRNESVGLGETEPKVKVYTSDYEAGAGSTDNDFIPRDSGDGLGGPKPDFAENKAKKHTSGNPDNYFQPYLENAKAKPSKFNKTASSKNTLIAKLKLERDKAIKVANTERLGRKKMALAMQIANEDAKTGIVQIQNDSELIAYAEKIAESESHASLERELARVRALGKVANSSAEPNVGAISDMPRINSGAISGISTLMAGTRFNAPVIRGDGRADDIRLAMNQKTTLGRLFGAANDDEN